MKIIRRLIALFRLNKRIVCEESQGERDYHDYPDDDGIPTHWHIYTCRRCGKKFTI